MRRPHVYERSAPRRRREGPQGADPGAAARRISRALPGLIALADAAGLEALADLLDAACEEAERLETGRPLPIT